MTVGLKNMVPQTSILAGDLPITPLHLLFFLSLDWAGVHSRSGTCGKFPSESCRLWSTIFSPTVSSPWEVGKANTEAASGSKGE